MDQRAHRQSGGADREQDKALDGDITLEEVEAALGKMAPWKSPGSDGVVGYVLKKGSRTAVWLTELFRVCLLLGCVPLSWKTGVIVPIPKKDLDKEAAENYRPITLQSVVAKCYESVLNRRGMEWVEQQGLLSDCQYAFRTHRGTQDALMHVTSTVDMRRFRKGAARARRNTYVLFGDVQKAYDEVCHEQLFARLLELKISGRWWFAVRSLYEGAVRCVRNGGELCICMCDTNKQTRKQQQKVSHTHEVKQTCARRTCITHTIHSTCTCHTRCSSMTQFLCHATPHSSHAKAQ